MWRADCCKHRPELCPAQVITVVYVTAAGREHIILLVTLIIKMKNCAVSSVGKLRCLYKD